MLCLRCKRINPQESLVCGYCGGSFGLSDLGWSAGGRRCPEGHLSEPEVLFCTTCGSTELSAPTASILVRPVYVIVSWLLFFIVCAVLWLLHGLLLSLLSRLCIWLFKSYLQHVGEEIFHIAVSFALILTLVYVVIHLIPPPIGPVLQRGLQTTVKLTCFLVKALIVAGSRTLFWIVQGTVHCVSGKEPESPAKTGKRRRP